MGKAFDDLDEYTSQSVRGLAILSMFSTLVGKEAAVTVRVLNLNSEF